MIATVSLKKLCLYAHRHQVSHILFFPAISKSIKIKMGANHSKLWMKDKVQHAFSKCREGGVEYEELAVGCRTIERFISEIDNNEYIIIACKPHTSLQVGDNHLCLGKYATRSVHSFGKVQLYTIYAINGQSFFYYISSPIFKMIFPLALPDFEYSKASLICSNGITLSMTGFILPFSSKFPRVSSCSPFGFIKRK